MRIQHDRSELHFVSRFIDGFVGLDEYRVTLVDVLQRGGVEKVQTARTASRQIVIAGTNVADLTRTKKKFNSIIIATGKRMHSSRINDCFVFNIKIRAV